MGDIKYREMKVQSVSALAHRILHITTIDYALPEIYNLGVSGYGYTTIPLRLEDETISAGDVLFAFNCFLLFNEPKPRNQWTAPAGTVIREFGGGGGLRVPAKHRNTIRQRFQTLWFLGHSLADYLSTTFGEFALIVHQDPMDFTQIDPSFIREVMES
jgi:hypothetical protein